MKKSTRKWIWHAQWLRPVTGTGHHSCPCAISSHVIGIGDLKQPRRRAEWTPTGSVLMKPATSAHVSDVVHMAFRAWHMLIFRPQVNVSIQSNFCRFCAHFTVFNTNVWKKKTFFVLFVEGWAVGEKDFERFSVNREPWFSMASAGKNPWVKVKCLCSP